MATADSRIWTCQQLMPQLREEFQTEKKNPQGQKHPLAFISLLFPAPAAATGFKAGFCPGSGGGGGEGEVERFAARSRAAPLCTAAGAQAGKERDGGQALLPPSRPRARGGDAGVRPGLTCAWMWRTRWACSRGALWRRQTAQARSW